MSPSPTDGAEGRAYQEAYWQALDTLLGPTSAATLRALFMARGGGQSNGNEVEVVRANLEEVLPWMARAADGIARRALEEHHP